MGLLLLGATVLFSLSALPASVSPLSLARIAAIGEVASILAGWSMAQYSNLLTPDLTLLNCAAPSATLRLLIIALYAGAVILLPSLFFLFRIFKWGPSH